MNDPWSILASRLTRLADRVDALPTVREATVAALSPLAVRFDTDQADTLVQGSLVAGPAVGQRVLTLKLRHYVWVLGVKGGGGTPYMRRRGATFAGVSTAWRYMTEPYTLQEQVGFTSLDGTATRVDRAGMYLISARAHSNNRPDPIAVSVTVNSTDPDAGSVVYDIQHANEFVSSSALVRLQKGDILRMHSFGTAWSGKYQMGFDVLWVGP